MVNILKEKENYLTMDLLTKRKLYLCGDDNFINLASIPCWSLFTKLKCINSPCDVQYNEIFNNSVSLFIGDITTLEIDCIVNAANKELRGGAGVNGAIHKAAGFDLLQAECKLLGNKCSVGEAKITGGYKLPAKYIIHTVGPIGEYPDLLKSCYINSCNLMKENNLKSIAFPCISTGIFQYPNDKAASVALEAVREWLESNHHYSLDRIIFCLFDKNDVKEYVKLMPKYFPNN